jgi:hypothetical protein
MARKNQNSFAALKDLDIDEPDFKFGPSILLGEASSSSAASPPPSSRSPVLARSSFAGAGAGAGAGPSTGGSYGGPLIYGGATMMGGASLFGGGVDLRSVADELSAVPDSGRTQLGGTTFDFSSFHSAAAHTEREIIAATTAAEREEAEKQRVLAARLAAMHDSERSDFVEKLDRDLSHSARQRRIAGRDASESFKDRLGAKVMKRNAAKKRLDKAKRMY